MNRILPGTTIAIFKGRDYEGFAVTEFFRVVYHWEQPDTHIPYTIGYFWEIVPVVRTKTIKVRL
jgi:hypothetical protein